MRGGMIVYIKIESGTLSLTNLICFVVEVLRKQFKGVITKLGQAFKIIQSFGMNHFQSITPIGSFVFLETSQMR